MEVGTVQTVVKYIFFAVVIGLLIYIVVYVTKVNYGGWKVEAKDASLRFSSPDGKSKFEFNQLDNSLTINNHKIKSGDTLGFFKEDGTFLTSMEPKAVRIGDLLVKDQTLIDDMDKKGVEFTDLKNQKVLSYVTSFGLNFPSNRTIIKSDMKDDNPIFSVYDYKNNKEVVRATAKQPLYGQQSLSQRDYYNIM